MLGGLILALVAETRVDSYALAFVMLTGLAYIALFLVQRVSQHRLHKKDDRHDKQ